MKLVKINVITKVAQQTVNTLMGKQLQQQMKIWLLDVPNSMASITCITEMYVCILVQSTHNLYCKRTGELNSHPTGLMAGF
jgi:hypothetical protein